MILCARNWKNRLPLQIEKQNWNLGTVCSDTSGTDCSDSMVPITTLRVVPIQRYRQKSGSSCIYSDQEWHAFSRQGIWLWFYHELLESETWEAKPTYKGFMGYGPGCAVLTDTKTGAETLSGIENRFLPTLLQNLLFADFRGITVLLFEDAFFQQVWILSFKHVS